MSKCKYKVDFSIDDLSLKKQQEVFEAVLSILDYNERQNFHISITDPSGGIHFIWDNTGWDPDGVDCKQCNNINCAECLIYEERLNKKNGKNNSNN